MGRSSVALALAPSLVIGAGVTGAPPEQGLATAATQAVDKHTVLVLPLQVEGDLPDQARRELAAQIHAGFEHAGILVVESAASACDDDDCLRELGREMHADYVVSTRIVAGGRDYAVQLRTLPVSGGRSATTAKVDCRVCGVAEVSDQLAAKARVMRDWILADVEPAQLRIEASPATATVSVDGELVGTVPFAGELSPGDHELVISAPHYHTKRLPFSAVGGATVQLVIELVAEPAVVVEPRPNTWRLPVAASAIGLGVAALVTGATFLGLDGRPRGSRCDDPANLDAEGDCKFIYTSGPAGIGLTVGGAVLTGLGIGLLVVDLRQRRRNTTAARVGVGVGVDRATLRVDF